MNWKLIVIGGLAMYAVMFLLGIVTGPIIHDGILKDSYKATSGFWRPELQQDPPDMVSLMPYWITCGLIGCLLLAAIYGWIRPAFSGPGWQRGLYYGICLTVFGTTVILGWSGYFNLPSKIWIWWALEQPIYYLLGGAALGWVAQKVAPVEG